MASEPAAHTTSVSVILENLPADVPATIRLLESDPGRWTIGANDELPVGLSVSRPGGVAPVRLRRLAITQKQIVLSTAETVSGLELQLFLETAAERAVGTVLLPIGTSTLFRSRLDRTNVLGSGSWSIRVGRGGP